jgi:hypothetical protein
MRLPEAAGAAVEVPTVTTARTLEALVEAALRAPSGDNTQPWRFQIDPRTGRVALFLDESRDPSPMNAGQRMARIALGAALENLLRAAGAFGLEVAVERPTPPALAVVRFEGSPAGDVAVEIGERVTNRRPYDGRPISAALLEKLRRQTPPRQGIATHWIIGAERLRSLAGLIRRADEMMLGNLAFYNAFLRNVRFDAPPAAEVEEGLSLASLELSATDRIGLRLLPRLPSPLRRLGLKPLAAHSKRLVESASALCLFVATSSRAETDLAVGQAVQSAWLALTASGLAAQPMMSLVILDGVLEQGSPETVASFGKTELEDLRAELLGRAPEIGSGRPAFFLRVGFAPPPTGRVGRRPLRAVTVQTPLG